jgi:hypothetical protein
MTSTILKSKSLIKPCEEELLIPQENAPARQSYQYINNRRQHMNYKKALDQGFLIGSGNESAYRYVIQKRLKIAGSCWKEHYIKKMLSLMRYRSHKQKDLSLSPGL